MTASPVCTFPRICRRGSSCSLTSTTINTNDGGCTTPISQSMENENETYDTLVFGCRIPTCFASEKIDHILRLECSTQAVLIRKQGPNTVHFIVFMHSKMPPSLKSQAIRSEATVSPFHVTRCGVRAGKDSLARWLELTFAFASRQATIYRRIRPTVRYQRRSRAGRYQCVYRYPPHIFIQASILPLLRPYLHPKLSCLPRTTFNGDDYP